MVAQAESRFEILTPACARCSGSGEFWGLGSGSESALQGSRGQTGHQRGHSGLTLGVLRKVILSWVAK